MKCPHCDRELKRAKTTWRGRHSLYCEVHGKVFPFCIQCGKFHEELEEFSQKGEGKGG